MNKIIKLLMLSDVLILTSFGLINPILAIFFKEDLVGGTIFTAGLASTIFLLTKCAIQMPFSRYVDHHNYHHRVNLLIIGTFLIALVPFIYIFSKTIHGMFIAQIIFGIGSGLSYPAWLGLWSTHLDKHKESFEWSLYSTFTGLGTAGTAAGGAFLASKFGFNTAFLIVGCVSVLGGIVILSLYSKSRHLIPQSIYSRRLYKKNKYF